MASDEEKVTVAIYYNGGFPRHHQVSRGFYERLLVLLTKKPWNRADIVVQRIR